jgi:hypothetical protein
MVPNVPLMVPNVPCPTLEEEEEDEPRMGGQWRMAQDATLGGRGNWSPTGIERTCDVPNSKYKTVRVVLIVVLEIEEVVQEVKC